jgi:hypothetical protein
MIEPGWHQNDESLQSADFRTTKPLTSDGNDHFSDIIWTRSSFPAMFSDSNKVSAEDVMAERWEWYWPPTGCHVRKKVIGKVLNASGAAVSSATVMLFNTATGLLVDTQTSAPDGSFTCGDPNAVNCFAVADLAGSPETAGTTIQELTGV